MTIRGNTGASSPESEDWQIGAVLVVEDDERSAALMKAIIETVSRRVDHARTAAAALDAIGESTFDLITIDLGLPDLDGRDLLHHVRQMTSAPVIIVSAVGQPSSVAQTLIQGADDYIVKPIRPAELRARIRAVTRRARGASPAIDAYSDRDLSVDFSRSEVVTAAGTQVLSKTERRLLREFLAQPGVVLSYDDLLKRVWGVQYEGDLSVLQVYVGYLRRKIDPDRSAPSRIRTHRGIGYEFVDRLD